MSDCYWGGEEDRFYYEVETGRIVGEILQRPNKTWEAFYYDSYVTPNRGVYIDDTRCRKVVETAHRSEQELWKRRQEAWKNQPEVVYEESEPQKTWWKIWE